MRDNLGFFFIDPSIGPVDKFANQLIKDSGKDSAHVVPTKLSLPFL